MIDISAFRDACLALEGDDLVEIHGLLVGIMCAVERKRGSDPRETDRLIAELRASTAPPVFCPYCGMSYSARDFVSVTRHRYGFCLNRPRRKRRKQPTPDPRKAGEQDQGSQGKPDADGAISGKSDQGKPDADGVTHREPTAKVEA
jgi:hypothetical protein